MTSSGLPHSDIPGSPRAYHSPRLIAVCHVLHRLRVPRHPPYALTCLTLAPLYVRSQYYAIVKEHSSNDAIVIGFVLQVRKEALLPSTETDSAFPRKEVIQPQVPLRLPCYDFTPITPHTLGAYLPQRGWPSDFWYTRLSWCDGRCVQGPGTYSPERADLRLLAIPASGRRVAADHPN